MNITEIIEDRNILPEAVIESYPVRPVGVLVKLLIDPAFAVEAQKLHEKYGARLTAFLISEARLHELEPDKLEEAFLDTPVSAYPDWNTARARVISIFIESISERRENDPKFGEWFDRDPDGLLSHFFGHLRFVQLGTGIYVVANRNTIPSSEE